MVIEDREAIDTMELKGNAMLRSRIRTDKDAA